jgi:ABC-2 type transport system permease protein
VSKTIELISINGILASLGQIGIATKYTVTDYVRSRRFLILLTVTLAISAILTLIIAIYRPAILMANSLSFYSGWWGEAATYIVVLSAIFFGGDAISGEFQNKTGYFLLPNPVKKSSIYFGKWLSALIASSAILAVFASIVVGNGIYYFGLSIPSELGQSLLFAWFYLVAALGLTFFFSSLFKNSSMSILITSILLLFGFMFIARGLGLASVEPSFILTYGGGIINNILTVPYPAHAQTTVSNLNQNLALTTFSATVPEGLVIMGIYFVITVILGLVLFERKEFT